MGGGGRYICILYNHCIVIMIISLLDFPVNYSLLATNLFVLPVFQINTKRKWKAKKCAKKGFVSSYFSPNSFLLLPFSYFTDLLIYIHTYLHAYKSNPIFLLALLAESENIRSVQSVYKKVHDFDGEKVQLIFCFLSSLHPLKNNSSESLTFFVTLTCLLAHNMLAYISLK